MQKGACAACRYAKCLEVGMCPEWIEHGLRVKRRESLKRQHPLSWIPKDRITIDDKLIIENLVGKLLMHFPSLMIQM